MVRNQADDFFWADHDSRKERGLGLRRSTLIVGLLALCIAALIASETTYIVRKILGYAGLGYVLDIFIPIAFILIINRETFSYVLLFFYTMTCLIVTLHAWTFYNGNFIHYEKSLTPVQDLMFMLSVGCFLISSIGIFIRMVIDAISRRGLW